MKQKNIGLFMAMIALALTGCPDPLATDQMITLLDIPGVTAPVFGATAVTTAIDTDQYTGTISWSPTASTFAANTIYTANIILTPKAGWTLTGVAADSLEVDGATVTHGVNSGTVTAVFPETGAAPDQTITLFEIPGVTAPVTGATPVTSITETTAQYSGTVAWSGSPATFAASTVYTATITLTAKTGYTFTDVAANFFTVAGSTSDSNPVNSSIVTVVFPATSLLTMAYVPSGSFQRDDTATNISIISQSYRMSVHEITRAQFSAVMGTDPSNTTYSSGTSDPVQKTNWYHAIAFCNKLSIAEGLTPVYAVTGVNFETLTYNDIPTSTSTTWDATICDWSKNGYRLPTEMEWMWAAMGAPADGQGGGTNTTGYAKAFAGSTGSNSIGDYAVYGYFDNLKNAGQTTTAQSNPVGSKTSGANEIGLYDMSGNVWEGVWDKYGSYPLGERTDYRGAASGTERVERSGSWGLNATVCTIAYRYPYFPYGEEAELSADDGFRVVRH